MSKTEKKKNNAIEFYRFLFSCIIFVLHSRQYGGFGNEPGHFGGGYLAVEFFLIVSGMLAAKGIEARMKTAWVKDTSKDLQSSEDSEATQDAEDAQGLLQSQNSESSQESLLNRLCRFAPVRAFVGLFRDLYSRYLRLYPDYILSILLLLVVRRALAPGFCPVFTFKEGLADVLAIQIFGRSYTINGQLWFVSGLIWASLLSNFLFRLHSKIYSYIIAPLFLVGFSVASWMNFGTIDLTKSELMFPWAFARCFAMLGLGATLSRIDFSSIKSGTLKAKLLGLLEIPLLAAAVAIMHLTRHSFWDYVCIVLLALLTICAFSGAGLLSRILDNRFSGALGAISYSMYLHQYTFQVSALVLFPGRDFATVVLISLAALIVFSAILEFTKWPFAFGRSK
ncbi:MAG: hypothetical protein GX975_06775 [Clostridiales bacterium]|nr:hypothetical protein [Clostridiales bacterium]